MSRPRPGAGAGGRGRRPRRGIPARRAGPARARRGDGAGAEPGDRLLLHLRLRAARPRAILPGHDVNYQAWSGALTPEGGTATGSRPCHRRPGRRPDRRLRDLRRDPGSGHQRRGDVPRRLHDRRAGHLDRPRRSRAAGRRRTSDGRPAPMPGYGLFATADGGQVALGVLNEQHFWMSLCGELALDALADLDFDERCRGAPSSRAPSARPSRASPVTSWSPAWSPPACRSPPCSTARRCWRPRRSPASRSAFRFPTRTARARARPTPRRGFAEAADA